MISITNPYTQQIITTFNCLNNDQLNDVLNHCKTVYNNWSPSEFSTRKQLGQKLAKTLINQKENFATLISLEMGKPIKESLGEIEKCAELVNYYTQNFEPFLAHTPLDKNTHIQYQPTGAVLGIMPWNFPFWQVFRFAFANIMAGNIALLKHAPNTMGCGEAIAKLFTDVGFPKGVFTNLMIDITQTEQVIAHKTVQGVCVTGSTKAGSAVGALAGKYLKQSVLELGGTDAAVILKDGNLNKALSDSFNARMANAGQVCIAPKRIFIVEEQLQLALDLLAQKIDTIKQGNPLDSNTTMGPISQEKFLNTLEQQIQQMINEGATLIKGGKSKTPFFEPTLMVCNPNNPVLKEEIFGPVICIVPYKTEKELIQNLNSTNYGLGTAIWTKDTKKAYELSNLIECGYIAINTIVKSNVKYPFGGVKQSGYGKELGHQGFKTFLNAKTVFTEL